MVNLFREKFGYDKKVVIGMIHLAGKTRAEKVERTLKELSIYSEEGVNGVIVEDYHGDSEDIDLALRAYEGIPKRSLNTLVGVNALKDSWLSFGFAEAYSLKFLQIDNVTSTDGSRKIENMRREFPGVCVLGGVRFKYQKPTGRTLGQDVYDAYRKCDAIVTTGEGTGQETPLKKLEEFRSELLNFPLIVGAGVNYNNVVEQLKIADGAIIGSYFKGGDTRAPVERELVKRLMGRVRDNFKYEDFVPPND